MKIPFLGGAYEGRSTSVASETCVNFFYEKGAGGECLVGSHGYELVLGLETHFVPEVEIRGGIVYNDKAYIVRGNSFGTLTNLRDVISPRPPLGGQPGNYVELGTLKTETGIVSMAHNGVRAGANQQIMVVDGQYGYIWDNVAQTFTQITDTDFVATDVVQYIDGYFIFPQKSGSDRFWITEQYDGSAVDPADFATAEGWPDALLNITVDNREVFLFGSETVEVWYNSGDSDNTFQRFQGGFKQHGCAARFSPKRIDNTVMWLSQNDRGDRQVVKFGSGYMPEVVSSPELNYEMAQYPTVSDAFAYTYQFEGHEFYVINFPSAEKTWAYDASTGHWHRRVRTPSWVDNWVGENFTMHLFISGMHIFGDKWGHVWRADSTRGGFGSAIAEPGSSIRITTYEVMPRERTTISISDDENRTRISSLQLDMEEGVFGDPLYQFTSGVDGTAYVTKDNGGPGGAQLVTYLDDDTVYLQYSKNGGHSWSSELKRDMGNMGDWAKRVIWRKLGWARNWIFRLTFYTVQRPILKNLIAKTYGE